MQLDNLRGVDFAASLSLNHTAKTPSPKLLLKRALGGKMASTDDQDVIDECELLLRTDHGEHENYIRSLQLSKDPYAIPFLEKAILLKPQLKYLDYDDYGSYYKKCFWALKDIGTPEAIAVIEKFAKSDDTFIKEQADYRLAKILGGSS